jgi:hypothetical protein
VKITSVRLLIAVLGMWPATSFAGTLYFIDLGKENNEIAAADRWNELSVQYKAIIGGLQFVPNETFDFNHQRTIQILAGPVISKQAAQKLCSKLFKEKVPCFVFESEEHAIKNVQAGALPWSSAKTQPPRHEVFFSWLFGDTAENSAPAKANVEVAEAIRVPLSNDDRKRQALKMEPLLPANEAKNPIQRAQVSFPMVTPPNRHGDLYRARRERLFHRSKKSHAYATAVNTTSIYWVQVASASNQIKAMDDWNQIRAGNADLLQGLHTRISTTLLGDSGYVVRVGPLHDAAKAADLCNSLKNRGISCEAYSN